MYSVDLFSCKAASMFLINVLTYCTKPLSDDGAEIEEKEESEDEDEDEDEGEDEGKSNGKVEPKEEEDEKLEEA